MARTFPEWGAADPSGSMRQVVDWFVEETRTTFLKDGYHTELFFLYRPDGQGSMGNPPPKMARDQFTQLLRQTIRMIDIFGVVHVVVAWVYVPKKPNDHTMKQILAGEMAVLDLKKGARSVCLLLRSPRAYGTGIQILSPGANSLPTGMRLAHLRSSSEITNRRAMPDAVSPSWTVYWSMLSRSSAVGSGRPEGMSDVPLGEGGAVAAAGAAWGLGSQTTKAVKSTKAASAAYHFQSRSSLMAPS